MKTTPNNGDVNEFLNSMESETKKKDSFELLEMMKQITGKDAVMWGPSIVGFDQYHYKYASGREGDMFKVGFSPRKQAVTVYIMPGFDREKELMDRLGRYKLGKSCLYIKNLDDVNRTVLHQLIDSSYKYMTEKYG